MSKRNLKLLAVLIILAGAAYLYQGPFQKWKTDKAKPQNIFERIDTQKLSGFMLGSTGKNVLITKRDNRFKVEGYKDFYVNKEVVGAVITALDSAKQAALNVVSTNKDKKSEFGLDDASAIKVTIFQDNATTSEFLVGRMGSDYASTYVSVPGSDTVYSVATNLISPFAQPDWRDTSIFASDSTKIAKLRFQYPGREFTMEKKDGKWSGTKPAKFDVKADKIDPVLALMATLNAQEIPEQNFKGTGLDKPSIIVEATGDGVKNTVMIGNKNPAGLYYAKRGDSDNIYLISKDQRDGLDKKQESFK